MQLVAAFATVFLAIGVGFLVQRVQSLDSQTLGQLSALVVNVLLPCYLFFTTATSSILESLSSAPILILMGVLVPLFSYGLATLALKPSRVAEEQRSAFRFSIMVANTAFLGIPVCQALFGATGAVHAVLYDFGTTLVALSLGIWELGGADIRGWRRSVFNPLIWSVLLGLVWAWTGWALPTWVTRPLSTLGSAALPLALLMTGAQVSNIRLFRPSWQRPLAGVITTRLVLAPLVVGVVLKSLGWDDLSALVVVVQSAMPVGLTTAIMAEGYGADSQFSASAIACSTLLSMVSLPLVVALFR